MALRLLAAASILTAFAAVWLPEVAAYWASPQLVDASLVQRAKTEPAQPVLEALRSQNLGPARHESLTAGRLVVDTPQAAIASAERVMRGEMDFQDLRDAKLHFPFDASNLDVGPPTMQLHIASMLATEALLRAHHLSGQEKYLVAAGEEISAFARVDRWRLVPRGLLWNDHALAARVAVLADYWALVRARSQLDPDHAREVLSLVQRTAERLAKPGLYTPRSNHGVMQNIALLQVAIGFPYLDSDGALRALGCARLNEQLRFYASPEGPVLEHSAGYHVLGGYLLGIAEELAQAANCREQIDWKGLRRRASDFTRALERPDGSLPAYGNTFFAEGPLNRASSAVAAPPAAESNFYPVAGQAVWWDQLATWPDGAGLAQTVVTWSNFPSRAHKLADDMSVIVWSGGQTWLTNVGYWPYGAAGEVAARGWRGSNAPHLHGESTTAARSVSVRGHGAAPRVRALDLERKQADNGEVLRRTVIDVDGRLWVIVDHAPGKRTGQVDRVWTIPPDVTVSALTPTEYQLRTGTGARSARLVFLGDLSAAPRTLNGSIDPFGGWVVRPTGPARATSVVVSQPAAASTVVAVLARTDAQTSISMPPTLHGSGADGWRIAFPPGYDAKELASSGNAIRVTHADGTSSAIELAPDLTSAQARQHIAAAYREVAAKYPRFPELTHYRVGLSLVLLILLLAQEAVLFVVRRYRSAWAPALRATSVLGWLALAGLIRFWYLA